MTPYMTIIRVQLRSI